MWYGVLRPDGHHPLYLCNDTDDSHAVSDDMQDADGFATLRDIAKAAKHVGWNPPPKAHVRYCVQVTRHKPGILHPL